MKDNGTKISVAPNFEAEAMTIDEFLRMLDVRENQAAEAGETFTRPLPRRAVFISELSDQRGTSLGMPSIRRYVKMGFAYGDDLITYDVTTSAGIEMPNAPRDGESMAERQHRIAAEIREKIEDHIGRAGLAHVLIIEGFLHHSFDPRAGGAS